MRPTNLVEIGGYEFFDLLFENEEFCAELGRVILAAGRLECVLTQALKEDLSDSKSKTLTLGQLIEKVKLHSQLSYLVPTLEMLKTQRNYVTHNIFSLLADHIEETILERKDLIAADVHTYTERAWGLKNNLNAVADIVTDVKHKDA